MNDTDFTFVNHGSITVLTPQTELAQEWFDQNLPVDDPDTQFWCKGIVIEPRYAGDILQGIQDAGLTVGR